ncbi:hypothetical protein BJ742DRAFT_458414 [Cladochytrium replicatum]|nr:hypothetical protein BJ742DRAFT_458414 [Cladochytrium replicatum]
MPIPMHSRGESSGSNWTHRRTVPALPAGARLLPLVQRCFQMEIASDSAEMEPVLLVRLVCVPALGAHHESPTSAIYNEPDFDYPEADSSVEIQEAAWSREVVSAASGSIPLDVLMTWAGPTVPKCRRWTPPLIVDTSLEQASLKRDLGKWCRAAERLDGGYFLFCNIPKERYTGRWKAYFAPTGFGHAGNCSSYWYLRTLIVNALNEGDSGN